MTEQDRDRDRAARIAAQNPRPIWRTRIDNLTCGACRGLNGQRVHNAKPPHPYCANRVQGGPGCRCLVETTLQEGV